MSFIALVDCNNFFVSCERIFNPTLIGRPVVVLSSNDGCIIARSQEVKNLGVPMGAPYFQWVDFLKAHHVFVCSSNFSLYGDLSHRVMQTLYHFNPQLEIYSIDEAFLYLAGEKDLIAHCCLIREKVFKWTGIPISIGIATTKTLAKVANRAAKKDHRHQGVCFPSAQEWNALLEKLEVGAIWGIGSRLSAFLAKKRIHTAAQLRDQPDLWVKSNLSIVGLRTVWELRGIPCLSIEEVTPAKQSIMTSRSFGRPIFKEEELLEAVCKYAARGAEKLREEKRMASWLQVFIMTSRHAEENAYANYAHCSLPEPTDYTPALLSYASTSLKSIFRQGFAYKRAGILLGGLVPKGCYQQNLFNRQKSAEIAKKQALMDLLDRANGKFGYQILQFASEGIDQPWQTKNQMRSECFTTRWSGLLRIKI